jgi:hypothetical protein
MLLGMIFNFESQYKKRRRKWVNPVGRLVAMSNPAVPKLGNVYKSGAHKKKWERFFNYDIPK